jgi:hypothetical protein
MGQTIKTDKWEFVLKEMYRTLKPGGFIELFESGMFRYEKAALIAKKTH